VPIEAVLVDIEGTVGSVRFVHDVLFPYARQRLPAFIETHGDRPEVQHWLQEAAREAGIIEAPRGEIIALLESWIDADRKATPLKALQGMIWAEGYAAGDFESHLYPDAVDKLRAWHAQGLPLYVYSSGSVEAQVQYFGHTGFGDLRPILSGYFDTTTGPKREWRSYHAIAGQIGVAPANVLFLSDITAELDAAALAGMRTYLIRRDVPDAAAAPAGPHPVANEFGELPY